VDGPEAGRCERAFDGAIIGEMLQSHEIESLRRSHAMAPLSAEHVGDLIDSCAQMAREREAIHAVLTGLASPFGDVRKALNDLQRIVSS
jgi:hypothetical protein